MHNCEIFAKLMKTPLFSNYLATKIKLGQKKETDIIHQPRYFVFNNSNLVFSQRDL